MKMLVTGGAGFLGAALVERLLAEGHAVDVVDDLSSGSLANLAAARADRSAELRIHQVDITSPEVEALVARRSPEVVFHLVTGVAGDAVGAAEVGVVGAIRVLEGARAGGARRVVAVGDGRAAYGLGEVADLPFRESAVPSPSAPQGMAWLALQAYLRWAREAHGVEFTSLLLADLYGPGQAHGPLVGVAEHLAAGEPCTVAGDPARTLDLLYLDDAVDAVVRASQRGGGLLLHVGTGRETTMRDAFRVLAGLAGRPETDLAVAPAPQPLAARFALDPGRARIHLGWSPWTTVADGLATLLR